MGLLHDVSISGTGESEDDIVEEEDEEEAILHVAHNNADANSATTSPSLPAVSHTLSDVKITDSQMESAELDKASVGWQTEVSALEDLEETTKVEPVVSSGSDDVPVASNSNVEETADECTGEEKEESLQKTLFCHDLQTESTFSEVQSTTECSRTEVGGTDNDCKHDRSPNLEATQSNLESDFGEIREPTGLEVVVNDPATTTGVDVEVEIPTCDSEQELLADETSPTVSEELQCRQSLPELECDVPSNSFLSQSLLDSDMPKISDLDNDSDKQVEHVTSSQPTVTLELNGFELNGVSTRTLSPCQVTGTGDVAQHSAVEEDEDSSEGSAHEDKSIKEGVSKSHTLSNKVMSPTWKLLIPPPAKRLCLSGSALDSLVVTDVKVDLTTFTFRECNTDKGFFRDK
ncbi:uncharacterized protein LOC134184378 isoform X2 [Corticium candelabrum]|uniref:uncharacterized protein LOC134184378 isoform X2 n=1 Tax=Corticium candelabrum TaxID=121492 RepID=UPI002E31FB5F|nr:uncharacterized protein LOC134184378 isoform X2 [Corticium candelabrum]